MVERLVIYVRVNKQTHDSDYYCLSNVLYTFIRMKLLKISLFLFLKIFVEKIG